MSGKTHTKSNNGDLISREQFVGRPKRESGHGCKWLCNDYVKVEEFTKDRIKKTQATSDAIWFISNWSFFPSGEALSTWGCDEGWLHWRSFIDWSLSMCKSHLLFRLFEICSYVFWQLAISKSYMIHTSQRSISNLRPDLAQSSCSYCKNPCLKKDHDRVSAHKIGVFARNLSWSI